MTLLCGTASVAMQDAAYDEATKPRDAGTSQYPHECGLVLDAIKKAALGKSHPDVADSLNLELAGLNLLAGQGRVAALRQAMLSVRARHSHPYFWAPFITIGRDAPLRQLASTSQ